jgi:hypothetical protein
VVIQKIVQKYQGKAFPEYQIQFDPRHELESIMENNPQWPFPPGVYDVIHGTQVVFEI